MPKVSVCMIVKNEEETIERAIKSIPSSYEIVIVDTGSNDNTKDILKRLGIQVYEYEWNDNFAEARNISISKAAGEYILIMDADERLTSGIDETISNFTRLNPGVAASVIIENDLGHQVSTHRMVRLFPNHPDYSFNGSVHEMLYRNGLPASYMDSDIRIFHTGYEPQYYERRNKADLYISLYIKKLNQNPDDGYMLYQLGKLYFSLNRFNDALAPLTRCLQIREHESLYFPVMLVMLGYTMKELGRSQEAKELLQHYCSRYPDFPDIPFLLGLLAMDTADLSLIEKSFQKSIQIGETTKYTTVKGVGSFKAAFNLGVFYEVTGEIEKARKWYEVSSSMGFGEAGNRLKNF